MNISLSQIVVRLPGRDAPLFSIPSLEIPTGSRVLIQGPSGRGKTTLLYLLSGQFLPDEGTIHIGGHDVTAMDEDARSRLRRKHFGIVFQRLNLLEHLTAMENIGVGNSGSQAFESAAANALTRMGLAPQSNQRCGTMSVGEQQRVAVARVVATQPDIFLADEPTSSLDNVNAETVMEGLCAAAKGRTLCVVSHDARIRRFFDTVIDFEQWVVEEKVLA